MSRWLRPAMSLGLVVLVLVGFGAAGYAWWNKTPPLPIPPSPASLRVEGDTIIVIRALPFRVVAPEGQTLYFWQLPDALKASGQDEVLTINAATKGAHRIRCAMLRFEGTKAIKTIAEIDCVVGDVPQPIPPVPPVPPVPPPPDDPLIKALTEAYSQETDPLKKQQVEALATVYDMGGQLMREKKPATAARVWKAVAAGAFAAKVNGKVVKVQQALLKHCLADLPTASETKIDDVLNAKMIAAFEKAAKALREVAK